MVVFNMPFITGSQAPSILTDLKSSSSIILFPCYLFNHPFLYKSIAISPGQACTCDVFSLSLTQVQPVSLFP